MPLLSPSSNYPGMTDIQVGAGINPTGNLTLAHGGGSQIYGGSAGAPAGPAQHNGGLTMDSTDWNSALGPTNPLPGQHYFDPSVMGKLIPSQLSHDQGYYQNLINGGLTGNQPAAPVTGAGGPGGGVASSDPMVQAIANNTSKNLGLQTNLQAKQGEATAMGMNLTNQSQANQEMSQVYANQVQNFNQQYQYQIQRFNLLNQYQAAQSQAQSSLWGSIFGGIGAIAGGMLGGAGGAIGGGMLGGAAGHSV